MRPGNLFVISGPSGAGKGTICEGLLDMPDVELSVSATTREPRGAEVPGVSYHFITREEFERIIGEGGFLEYASVYGNMYGTPKELVLEKLSEGKDVILEIEMQGATQVRASHPECILIFVLPPSMAELRKRIESRRREQEGEISLRMRAALSEMELIKDYDYFVVNGELEEAVEVVKSIIIAERAKVGERTTEILKAFKEEK